MFAQKLQKATFLEVSTSGVLLLCVILSTWRVLLISQHLFLCLYSGLLSSRADDHSEVILNTHRQANMHTIYRTILSWSCHFSNNNEMTWKFSMVREFLWIWQGILPFSFCLCPPSLTSAKEIPDIVKVCYAWGGGGGIGTVLSEKISHFPLLCLSLGIVVVSSSGNQMTLCRDLFHPKKQSPQQSCYSGYKFWSKCRTICRNYS